MWLYLAVVAGLYYVLRWYRERQVVSHLRDKFVFITGCDSGFGNLLARQLDLRGLRVLAACLTEQGAEQLRNQTSDRLETVILDVTKTESIAAAAEWVKERVGDRGLWGLVNNAGISVPTAPNEWLTKGNFVNMLDVNLLGVIKEGALYFGVKVTRIKPGQEVCVQYSVLSRSFQGARDQSIPEVKELYGEIFLASGE